MKKTKRYHKQRQYAQDNKTAENKRTVSMDSFSNPLARLGSGTPNLLEGTEYPITRLTQNYTLLNSLYRSHWIARKIIDCIPEDMIKNWITLQTQLEPDEIKRFDKLFRTTRVQRDILQGLKLGRLYGGAGAVIIIEGHEDILDQPLDYDTIMPGSFKGMIVSDRWIGLAPTGEMITDVTSPDFGLPEYYSWVTDDFTVKVHHSRVLRFIGRELPPIERYTEQQWGSSEIEVVFDEIKKRDNTSWNIAQLVFMANLSVFKLEGLGELFAVGEEHNQQDLYNSMTLQNILKSNMGALILGKDDEFQNYQYTFSGLNDIYESFMLDVAGAAEMPVTKLFGRAPAGMNATGESDMQNYYNTVEQKQTALLEPVLDKLLPIMFISEFGAVPDDLDYVFNPMETPSDDDLSNIVDKKANTIINAYSAGLISQKIGMKELRQMADSTGMFTNITDEDIENADSDISEGIGDMPLSNNEENSNILNFKLPSSEILPTFDGGKGSGNFGHEGRLGEIGGSGRGGKSDIDNLDDDEQFKKIKEMFEGEAPQTIEDYKELKYNNSNKWENIIRNYKTEYARNYIKSDKQLKKIDIGNQNKHIIGTNNYKQKAANLKNKKQYGPSYINIENKKIQELINKHSGEGYIRLNKNSEWDDNEIILNNDEVVGIAVNNLTGKEVETTVFKIHYGDKGAHMVPDYPSKKKGLNIKK